MTKFESVKGVIKRREQRVLGLFVDGTGLDRATRRINRKVDLGALVRGVTGGTKPMVARYYTIIPNEDDSRQRAFLDAVYRAGLAVIVKRLPPKGVTRHVSVDVQMAADIVAFAMGHSTFSSLGEYDQTQGAKFVQHGLGGSERNSSGNGVIVSNDLQSSSERLDHEVEAHDVAGEPSTNLKRMITVVCPSRELSYAIARAKELGVETSTADFGNFSDGDVLKSAAKWIDLADSETIWRP